MAEKKEKNGKEKANGTPLKVSDKQRAHEIRHLISVFYVHFEIYADDFIMHYVRITYFMPFYFQSIFI